LPRNPPTLCSRQTQQNGYNLFVKYRCTKAPGSAFFFTVVTFDRRKIFTNEQIVALLRRAIAVVQVRRPFKVEAAVILPDHFHMIWRLPESEDDYATPWRLFKTYFTRRWSGDGDYPITPFRQSKGERAVWQRHYWEHLIRDEADWRPHVDYIHYNPVKHGLARGPGAWPYSSFHTFVKQGYYSPDWRAWEGVDIAIEVGGE
jgi:putative transposase